MRKYKELLLLFLLVVVFISIRSLHFSSYLNFSTDQGLFSLEALEIFLNKIITLIGPPTSYIYQGREIFQGSIIYYVFLVFLLLGNFDPVTASYIFMLFSAVMVIPLYYGTKYLITKDVAWCMCILYTLLPFYIDYTRFLWNPNFQFVLVSGLILFMGLYERTKKIHYLFLISMYSGFLLQFHYQFILVIVAITGFYFLLKRVPLKYLVIYVVGFIVGFSPLIIFELRNNFYNIQTIWMFVSNDIPLASQGTSSPPHYFLSISLFCFLIAGGVLKNILKGKIVVILLGGSLFILSSFLYIQNPTHAFGMIEGWNYKNEEKVHEIIKNQKISNFNVINLTYDTKALVQKYLLKKNNLTIDGDNYLNNKFLFVITDKNDPFLNDPAYEISTFKPSSIINTWEINNFYVLYLLRRDTIR